MLTKDDVEVLIRKHKELIREKEVWNPHWQLVGEYINTRKQDFTTKHSRGEFLNEQIFDSTGPNANDIMASALIGALWPNGARSFKLNPPTNIVDTVENKNYYDEVTKRMAKHMDNPRAGLTVALEEYMTDQGSFGTSGIGIFDSEREDSAITFRAWDVKHMAIDEDEAGFVDTIYFEIEMSIGKAIKKYGLNALSPELREQINLEQKKMTDKMDILHIIEPREKFNPDKKGVHNMPWMSVHIEMKHKHIIRESGFESMPVKVARFSKRIGEKYGRSPGMLALPDIMVLNTVWEALTVAIEKQLDPPLAVLDDGRLGGGKIDTSAGAVNVFQVTGRIGNESPVFPIFTVGDINAVDKLIAKLEEAIMQRFKVDRLLDLNNETQMTLGEAQIRNNLRAATLRNLFSRQIAELFSPLIERTFDVLFNKGELGVLPGSIEELELIGRGVNPAKILYIPQDIAEAMATGQDVYEIEYVTPAMRMMQADEADGMVKLWDFMLTYGPQKPEMFDNVDEDESVRIFSELVGSPVKILRSKKKIQIIREERAQLVEEQRQQDAARQTSETARNFQQAVA